MTYRSLLGYFSSESTMFTSLPPRRLKWSAWAAGRSSPNCVPAPYSGNVTSRTRQNRVRVTRPGRRRICGSIVFGQNALMPMVQGLEGQPLWGKAVVPLVDYSAAWKLLPNVSRWAGSGNGTRSEHSPEGGDHRGGPCSRQESGFCSRTSLFRGKGLRPS